MYMEQGRSAKRSQEINKVLAGIQAPVVFSLSTINIYSAHSRNRPFSSKSFPWGQITGKNQRLKVCPKRGFRSQSASACDQWWAHAYTIRHSLFQIISLQSDMIWLTLYRLLAILGLSTLMGAIEGSQLMYEGVFGATSWSLAENLMPLW